MASTTPTTTNPTSHNRSNSHSRTLPSRPTTPLRPPSRTSLRASQTTPTTDSTTTFPLNALEPAFSEFSDSMADLEANMLHLQLLNESLNRFNENFGAFLYGMNMSAFCVDFPEAPLPQSFARYKDSSANNMANSPFTQRMAQQDSGEATFLTNDTSFIENPPMSSKASSKFSSVPGSAAGARQTPASTRGAAGRGRAAAGGIPRGTSTRGARGGTTGGRAGSGIARGVGRGRGVR